MKSIADPLKYRKENHKKITSISEDLVFKILDGIIFKEICWDHSSYKEKAGYHIITIKNKKWRLHRLMWMIFNESTIDDGKIILHGCDNRWCVNPLHLSQGTDNENFHDMRNKGRESLIFGNYKKYFQRFCKFGHEFTNENTYVYKSGHRRCKTCNVRNTKKLREDRKKKNEINFNLTMQY